MRDRSDLRIADRRHQSRDYRFLVKEQLADIGAEAKIVIEPRGAIPGPAVAVAAVLAAQLDPESTVAVFASDHVITKRAEFLAVCVAAAAAAEQGFIVTLGVRPNEPATGYGYIRPGRPIGRGPALEIEAFVEKPERSVAERYVAEGYLWNSGNFFFRADVMLGELRAFEPEIAAAAEQAIEKAGHDLGFLALDAEAFGKSPKKSIDYAVMERTQHAAVVPADIGWSDVGSWDAVWKLEARRARKSRSGGEGLAIDSGQCACSLDGTADRRRRGEGYHCRHDAGRGAGAGARPGGQGQAVAWSKIFARASAARRPSTSGCTGRGGYYQSVDEGYSLSSQAHRRHARTPAFAATAFPSRRALGRRHGHRRG